MEKLLNLHTSWRYFSKSHTVAYQRYSDNQVRIMTIIKLSSHLHTFFAHHLACLDETYSQSTQQRLHRLTRAAATSPCMRASFSGALRRRCSNDDGGIKRLRSTCSRRHDHVITVNDVGEHASWLRLDKDIAAMVSAWCEAACAGR